MKKDFNKDLYKKWDERWKGSEKSERLTMLGKMMFKSKVRALRKVLSSVDAKTVIEVGCGLGHVLQLYHEDGYNAIGIDVSPNSIEVCTGKGLKALLKDVKDEKKKYDLVSSDGMLEHFLNFEQFALQFMRISKRYVLLIQPNYTSFMGKTLAYLAGIFREDENIYEYNYRIEDFTLIFQNNGFDLITSEPVFFDVFRILIFEKSKSKGVRN